MPLSAAVEISTTAIDLTLSRLSSYSITIDGDKEAGNLLIPMVFEPQRDLQGGAKARSIHKAISRTHLCPVRVQQLTRYRSERRS